MNQRKEFWFSGFAFLAFEMQSLCIVRVQINLQIIIFAQNSNMNYRLQMAYAFLSSKAKPAVGTRRQLMVMNKSCTEDLCWTVLYYYMTIDYILLHTGPCNTKCLEHSARLIRMIRQSRDSSLRKGQLFLIHVMYNLSTLGKQWLLVRSRKNFKIVCLLEVKLGIRKASEEVPDLVTFFRF